MTTGGTCWFCKGRFPVDALIAGYDTFEEQRLACLACNERMSGNWRPAAAKDDDYICSCGHATDDHVHYCPEDGCNCATEYAAIAQPEAAR